MLFGKSGVKQVLDGFGCQYEHFHQLSGRAREVVVQRMKEALKHETVKNKHRMVMKSDNSALERVWVAADGRETPISKMGDGHLHNTILLIDRRIEQGQWVIGRNEDLQELRAMMEEEREKAHAMLREEGVIRPINRTYRREAFVDNGVLFHKVIGSSIMCDDKQIDIFTDRDEADNCVRKMNAEVKEYFDKYFVKLDQIEAEFK